MCSILYHHRLCASSSHETNAHPHTGADDRLEEGVVRNVVEAQAVEVPHDLDEVLPGGALVEPGKTKVMFVQDSLSVSIETPKQDIEFHGSQISKH